MQSKVKFGFTLALGLALAVLSACAGTRAAYKAVDGKLDLQAYVVAEHYSAVVTEAANLKDAGARADLVLKMQQADNLARPLVLSLEPLANAYTARRTPEAEAALAAALDKAVEALTQFINVVKEARQ